MISLPLIPRPRHLESSDEFFSLSHLTSIQTDCEAARDAIEWFCQTLHQLGGVSLQNGEIPAPHSIQLLRQSNLKPENYTLHIASSGIEIRAGDASGFFYALVSLLQLVPLDCPAAPGKWHLPGVQIEDGPRFGWRGLMLDSARHFQPVWWVKKFIDAMAGHKLNVLHWHLTDDQGWRVEIEKYPALASVSAWRKESRVGHEIGSGANDFDGRPHGGFYLQEQLREIVAYALARGVTIVPEIEMPGHATAVLAAYPELSCAGHSPDGGQFEVSAQWGIFDDVFCAGNDEVLRFMEDVLVEVLAIFPSQFIHVGGDECHKTRWKECPKCQKRIRDENLADENELQAWFVQHLDAFLSARGRRLIGWDEILEGGLARGATVMSWRGQEGGIAAARAGHDVVMAPHEQTYFDYYQGPREGEPLSIGGDLPLEKVYAHDVVPAALSAEEARHVLGGQGQLWTEYMPRPENVEYMAYPRACALAEGLWSEGERDFGEFSARLRKHLRLLDRMQINYRAPKAQEMTN